MITHSDSPVTHTWEEKKKPLDIHATTGLAKEHNIVVSVHHVIKWFGASSTVLLSVAALAPNILRIPANLQPWVFLTAIFWALAFCAGMFDL